MGLQCRASVHLGGGASYEVSLYERPRTIYYNGYARLRPDLVTYAFGAMFQWYKVEQNNENKKTLFGLFFSFQLYCH